MTSDVSYDEHDPPIRELVRVLNEFDGISTISACGGHESGTPGDIHAAVNEWWVTLELAPADPEGQRMHRRTRHGSTWSSSSTG